MKRLISFVWGVAFWGIVVVKCWGTAFAAWSWWWLFVPIVPWIGLAVKHYGL